MAFQPGTSGNKNGRPKKAAITDLERIREGRRTWARLLEIRDGLLREERDYDGKKILVSPSVRDLLRCCEMILDRTIGKPAQTITGPNGDPLQIEIAQVINAPTEIDVTENSLPICISGS